MLHIGYLTQIGPKKRMKLFLVYVQTPTGTATTMSSKLGSSKVDPDTGYLIDLKLLNNCIKERVTDKLDHRNLNVEVEEFTALIPTVENIAMVIYNRLRPHIDPSLELFITLWETPRNRAEYPAR